MGIIQHLPGLPKIDFDTQCKMLYTNDFSPLYRLVPELDRYQFSQPLIASYITVSRTYYKQYLKNMGIIRYELQKYSPTADGVFLVAKGLTFEMISRERGAVSVIRTFATEDELLDMLAFRYRGSMCK